MNGHQHCAAMARRRGALLAAMLSCANMAQAKEHLIDAVAATVDSEVVLYSEIIDSVKGLVSDIEGTASSPQEANEQINRILRQELDNRIETIILYREAQLGGLAIDETVLNEIVEEQINEVRAEFETNEQFMREIQNSGLTLNDVREQNRKKLVANAMRTEKERQISRDIRIAEQDITQYYDDHASDFSKEERVLFRQIMIPWGSEDEQAAARARIELIQEELAAGADFAELAKAYSKLPGAEAGGLMGWQVRGDLVEHVEETVFSLDVGEVSGVVETTAAYNLFKVDQRQDAGRVPLRQVRAEIESRLRAEATEEKFDVWMNDLRRRARVRTFL